MVIEASRHYFGAPIIYFIYPKTGRAHLQSRYKSFFGGAVSATSRPIKFSLPDVLFSSTCKFSPPARSKDADRLTTQKRLWGHPSEKLIQRGGGGGGGH